MVAVGYDSDDMPVFNPPMGSFIIGVGGPPSTGIVPGVAGISTLTENGTDSCHLWVLANGRVCICNDYNIPLAKMHVRGGGFLGQGAEFNDELTSMFEAHDGQTKDISQWGQELVLQMAVQGNPSDGSVFLNDTTLLPPTGSIFMRYTGEPVPFLAYKEFEYTANNTGTGELTLAAPLTGTIISGEVVFYVSVLSKIDVKGAWHPPVLADADAQNSSVYESIDAGNKLVYKDSGGVVNALY